MAKNGKIKTVAAIITCAVLVAITWTGFIVAGSEVKVTAEHAKEGVGEVKATVVELKEDGCDPVQKVGERVIVLETKWEAIDKSQQRLEVGQQELHKRFDRGQREILKALEK